MPLSDFLSAYRGREAQMAAQPMQEMRQVGALQGILAQAQKQQMAQQAAQKQAAFETAMRQAGGDPKKMAEVAVQFGDPKDVLSHLDRQTTAANTKEMALARLNQAAQQGAQTFALRAQVAKTTAERAQIEAEYKQFQANVARERLRYDTGATVAPFAPLPVSPAPSMQPIPNNGGVSVSQWGPMAAGTPPEVAAAAGQLRNNLAQGGPGGTIDLGVLQTQPAPQAEPAMPMQQPAAPNNFDARDLRLQGMGQPAAAAPSAPVRPTMPTFSGSPRERAAAENRWRLQQDKPSIAGNAPITPETATRLAQQVLTGDTSALSGLARNQSALAQINNEVTRLAAEQGVTGADIAGRRGSNAANRTALTAVTKDLVAITPFKQMLDQNADIAITLGRRIAEDKTNSAFINRPLLWVKNNLSDRPDIAEYLAQMHFVEVEAARVLTQPRLVGQLTDQSISDMKSVLSGNMTIASTEAVLKRIQSDGNNRINAMKAQQARTLAEIKGQQPRTRESDKTGVDTNNPLLR